MNSVMNISGFYNEGTKLFLEFDDTIDKSIVPGLINNEEVIDIGQNYVISGKSLQIEFGDLIASLKTVDSFRWKLVFFNGDEEVKYTNKALADRIKKEKVPMNLEYKSTDVMFETEDVGGSYIFYVNANNKGELYFVCAKEKAYGKSQVQGYIRDVDIKNGILTIKYEFPKCKFEYLATVFKHRRQNETEALEITVEEVQREELADRYVLISSLNLKEAKFKVKHWDFVIKARYGKRVYDILGKVAPKLIENKISAISFRDVVKTDDGMVVVLHKTLGNSISLIYRQAGTYDGVLFKIKERIAKRIYDKNKQSLQSKNIYLVFEKLCQNAQDNGYYFFQYCMENNVESLMNGKIYYVITKDSPDRKKLEKYKENVLDFMSYKHIIYLLSAKLLISTDEGVNGYIWDKCASILDKEVRKKKTVFLQHGVISLKKVPVYKKKASDAFDLFITSTNKEKEIVCKNLDYNQDEVVVTGLSRWDVMEDKSEGGNEIILVPTWRRQLEGASKEEFLQSSYYKAYMDLLTSERLKEILEKKDLYLTFYLHFMMKSYLENFDIHNDRVRLVEVGEKPLNEMMMRSRMLITDYSSVAWDVFYQGKPVLFYQFDLEEYNEMHGSYIDMETDLFGDRATELNELLDLLEETISNDFAVKEKYAKMKLELFPNIDKNNSKRIVEAIMERGW